MPFSVLLEIALQPCGWLAAYCGSALTSPEDLKFRNLGGKAIKMVYAPAGSAERVSTVEVSKADRTRFSLDDDDIVALARQALIIEEHYKKPMDIEWGKDGSTGQIYILQARPETVQSRAGRTIQRFSLKSSPSRVLASGRSIGQRIGSGPARVIRDLRSQPLAAAAGTEVFRGGMERFR